MNIATEATLSHVIFYSLIGGMVSLLGGILLLGRKNLAEKLARYATPFAAGALLAAVFLDLLPEGIEDTSPKAVLLSTLGGIVLFFLAERFLHWFHHHHQHDGQGDPARSLIVVGDTVHNALDGVAIAAAFLISVPTGIVTTIAVAAHEIPQEIGDFGLLLAKGMSRIKVLLVNVLSAAATVVMAILTYAIGDADRLPIGVLLGLSAGFLLYIAMSDIIPEIHEQAPRKRLFNAQPILLLIGVMAVGLVINLSHRYIAGDHHKDEAFALPVLLCIDEHETRLIRYDHYFTYPWIERAKQRQGTEAESCGGLPDCREVDGITVEGDPVEPCLDSPSSLR